MSSLLPPRWNEVIAVFGGRFDPPHLGHLEAVRGLFARPGIRQVRLLPSATPPHKPAVASIDDRVEMIRRCFHSPSSRLDPKEVPLDFSEVERARLRPSTPNYTFDTLQELGARSRELGFVIGADQLNQMTTWHRFPEVLQLSHWIVLARKPAGEDLALITLQEWEASGLIQRTRENHWWIRSGRTFLTLAPTDAPDISSTRIRETITRTGEPPRENLSTEVRQYLMERRLYGSVGPRNETEEP